MRSGEAAGHGARGDGGFGPVTLALAAFPGLTCPLGSASRVAPAVPGCGFHSLFTALSPLQFGNSGGPLVNLVSSVPRHGPGHGVSLSRSTRGCCSCWGLWGEVGAQPGAGALCGVCSGDPELLGPGGLRFSRVGVEQGQRFPLHPCAGGSAVPFAGRTAK